MPKRVRVVILNSYTLTRRRPQEQVRVRAFVEALAAAGYRAGDGIELALVDSNDLDELDAALARELDAAPVDLIHAVGTPNAILAKRRAGGIPIVYYGAHPEGVGLAECAADNIRGVRLTLPFTSSYKRYRFVRRLLPQVQRVYVPFYTGTVFCPPTMGERHRRFREAHPGTCWVPGDSEWIGYRALAGLNYIVGLDYRELAYADLGDLQAALECIDPRSAFLMAYNDSVYCRDAPQRLAEFALERGLPLLWNNNPEATQIGALAGIAGCFKEAGRICGEQTTRILDTGTTAGVESVVSSRSYASFNLARAAELGLEPSADVLAAFDELVESAALVPGPTA